MQRHRSARTGVVALASILVLLFGACRKDTGLSTPAEDRLAGPIRPPHFPPPHYDLGKEGYSKAGFELGRRLFHDRILSVDNSISCASCHRQEGAFSDPGMPLSFGVLGKEGRRNSPPIFNNAWSTSFMWDGGVTHIEVVPFAPISDHLEMGDDLANVVRKLNEHPAYPALFEAVFQRTPIDDQQLFLALARYTGNLVSADSPYDRYVQGGTTLTTAQRNGLEVFRAHCASCHQEPLFTDQGFHNNGLDTVPTDEGRHRITLDPADLGRFKTPSLRNVALTAPYMHDGRFPTLEAVVDHYASGIVPSNTLDAQLLPPGGLGLSQEARSDLIAFLHSLTDPAFVTDPELRP